MNVALRELRLERDLTIEALAGLARVGTRTVSRAERGLPIRLLHEQRIAKALGVSGRSVFGPLPGEEERSA